MRDLPYFYFALFRILIFLKNAVSGNLCLGRHFRLAIIRRYRSTGTGGPRFDPISETTTILNFLLWKPFFICICRPQRESSILVNELKGK